MFRKKGKTKNLILCACAACICIFAANLIVVETAKPYIITEEEAIAWAREDGAADCILVLGASVSERGPSGMLADRLVTGMDLFENGVSEIMLLSGDNGKIEYNEVQTMKDYVLNYGENIGVTKENIYLDYAGFSTYDSAYRAKEIFQAKRVVIVTQRYHLYRAVYNARTLGIDAVGVAARDTKNGQTRRDIREIFARVKDIILTHVDAKPTLLGEPVPLVYPSTQP